MFLPVAIADAGVGIIWDMRACGAPELTFGLGFVTAGYVRATRRDTRAAADHI